MLEAAFILPEYFWCISLLIAIFFVVAISICAVLVQGKYDNIWISWGTVILLLSIFVHIISEDNIFLQKMRENAAGKPWHLDYDTIHNTNDIEFKKKGIQEWQRICDKGLCHPTNEALLKHLTCAKNCAKEAPTLESFLQKNYPQQYHIWNVKRSIFIWLCLFAFSGVILVIRASIFYDELSHKTYTIMRNIAIGLVLAMLILIHNQHLLMRDMQQWEPELPSSHQIRQN